MNLEWGLKDVIPDDAVAAWGARVILTKGRLDILHDRYQFHFSDDATLNVFIGWLNDVGRSWLKSTAKDVYPDENLTHALDEGRFHIRCNAQTSYGYLYVGAWMDPATKEN